MPAGSVWPIGDDGSISMSMYRPLLRSSIEDGLAASPRNPENAAGLASAVTASPRLTCSAPSTIARPVTSA